MKEEIRDSLGYDEKIEKGNNEKECKNSRKKMI